ncbi:hypothetical protein GIB67_007628 [Kingdonia uniflora]|uniref:Uncharacterized protein n=1 Tax=Kingdonia uniflora TaxID=39325 RepID=A0A7J7N1J9_9MAGN|nr:hypothetical protein GIB67_007628 [Kingdonia uniflora]
MAPPSKVEAEEPKKMSSSSTRPVPRRESPWGLPEGETREPKAHRCNDRAEDVIYACFEGNPFKTIPGPFKLFWQCIRSKPGMGHTEKAYEVVPIKLIYACNSVTLEFTSSFLTIAMRLKMLGDAVIQIEGGMEEKHLYHVRLSSHFIETHKINRSVIFKRRRLIQCHDLSMVEKEAGLLPESSNKITRISFKDCGVSHVKFHHHDVLVVMLKMRNVLLHTMMVDTGNGIELLFQSTINQMGLTDQVEASHIDISGFNGSKE